MVNILVVEDFNPLRDLYTKFLSSNGYSVVSASGYQEALTQLIDSTPDVVLLDMALKDGDGLGLTSFMKNGERFQNTKIVAITGNNQYEQLAEETGVDYFLYKPVSMFMLQSFLERLMAEKQQVVA